MGTRRVLAVAIAMLFSLPYDAYAQQGVQAGEFLILPRLDLRETYDDNIYNSDTDEKSDFITRVQPSLTIGSQFDKHAISLNGDVDAGFYGRHSADDFVDWRVGASGRADVAPNSTLSVGVRHRQAHEDRGSELNSQGKAPLEYQVTSGNVGGQTRIDRVGLRLDGSLDSYEYEDVEREGATTLSSEDRDRDEHRVAARAGYALSQQLEIFFRPSVTDIDYSRATDDNGLDKDSSGYEIMAGLGFGAPGLVSGEVAAGYIMRDFDEPTFDNEGTVGLSGFVEYLPTSRIVVRASGNRQLAETEAANTSILVSTGANLSVEFQVLRALKVQPSGGYTLAEYRRTPAGGGEYDERTISAGLSTLYEFTENFYGGLSYNYSDKSSDLEGSDYVKNTIMLRLGLQF